MARAGREKGSAKRVYRDELRALQVELVRAQRHVIKHGHKVLVIFEGRDASGKDGAIKRVTQHLSPRETRVVALGAPSDRERSSWYFQRFVPHLPAAQEMTLFNRSWYNRAGVERVMGFCSERECEDFFAQVLPFEHMLIDSGMQVIKYYLDICEDEQKKRLHDRARDPLKQWKVSPIDSAALEHWRDYSKARDAMLERASSARSPWLIVKADDKRAARLNILRDILTRLDCPGRRKHLAEPDRNVVFAHAASRRQRLAR